MAVNNWTNDDLSTVKQDYPLVSTENLANCLNRTGNTLTKQNDGADLNGGIC